MDKQSRSSKYRNDNDESDNAHSYTEDQIGLVMQTMQTVVTADT